MRDQRAVAVVGVGRRAARSRAVERVVGVRGAVVGQVAGIVVGETCVGDLIGDIVGGGGGRATVELHGGAVVDFKVRRSRAREQKLDDARQLADTACVTSVLSKLIDLYP